jgi:multimeric flavodoxin WrbA
MKLKTILEELYSDAEMQNPNLESQRLEFGTKLDLLNGILIKKKKVLLLACSNRTKIKGVVHETPKSTALAYSIQDKLKDIVDITVIDVPSLKIFPCEGNVSRYDGNSCGVEKAILHDNFKNPSGMHRCWASLNEPSDELWKVSKELFQSDAVIFFASVRWGQANMFYQNLIERLTWIENLHSTLNRTNPVSHIDAGFICVGQNWNGENVVETQKKVLEYYGFKTPPQLSFNWQYTENSLDETQESYKNSRESFNYVFDLTDKILYK